MSESCRGTKLTAFSTDILRDSIGESQVRLIGPEETLDETKADLITQRYSVAKNVELQL